MSDRPEGDYTIPDATQAPLHPIIEATEHAVHTLLRRWPIYSDEARKFIRVEINHDIRRELIAHLSPSDSRYYDREPMQIMGVSYYTLYYVPEPGWRILP